MMEYITWSLGDMKFCISKRSCNILYQEKLQSYTKLLQQVSTIMCFSCKFMDAQSHLAPHNQYVGCMYP